MKYVVWGCGRIGSRVVRMMGEMRRIVAIVEGDKKLQGSTYCGIPIISFEEFLLNFSEYPVIVTPFCHEDEIMEQLKLKNIIGAFSFIKERGPVESLLVQLSIDQTLKRYQGTDNLAIYGVSLLGLILYDLFLENGFKVSLVIPSNTDLSLKKYITETLKLKAMSVDDIKENNMKFLLATELEKSDQSKLYGMPYDTYYDLHLNKELFYNPELEKFRNIHEGKRCFIVATGPSLRIDDLNTLYNNREICISVNGIFRTFDQTKWRPNYYVVADPATDVYKKDILEMDVQAKFVADVVACFNDKHYDNVYKWHLIRRKSDQLVPEFSDDFSRGGCFGNTVVYEGAMQLAVYMGFREIYLLGTDCTILPDGRIPHFETDGDETEDNSWAYFWQKATICSYQVAKQYTDSHGIKIYNATRGGELEVFPRVSFDSLFS